MYVYIYIYIHTYIGLEAPPRPPRQRATIRGET